MWRHVSSLSWVAEISTLRTYLWFRIAITTDSNRNILALRPRDNWIISDPAWDIILSITVSQILAIKAHWKRFLYSYIFMTWPFGPSFAPIIPFKTWLSTFEITTRSDWALPYICLLNDRSCANRVSERISSLLSQLLVSISSIFSTHSLDYPVNVHVQSVHTIITWINTYYGGIENIPLTDVLQALFRLWLGHGIIYLHTNLPSSKLLSILNRSCNVVIAWTLNIVRPYITLIQRLCISDVLL